MIKYFLAILILFSYFHATADTRNYTSEGWGSCSQDAPGRPFIVKIIKAQPITTYFCKIDPIEGHTNSYTFSSSSTYIASIHVQNSEFGSTHTSQEVFDIYRACTRCRDDNPNQQCLNPNPSSIPIVSQFTFSTGTTSSPGKTKINILERNPLKPITISCEDGQHIKDLDGNWCSYNSSGISTVSISGEFEKSASGSLFSDSYFQSAVLDILQWGDYQLPTDMSGAFSFVPVFESYSATDIPNFSPNTDLSNFFYGSNFNGEISNWDVSNVSNMSFMFSNMRDFNKPLSWNTVNVTDMTGMFYNSSQFNSELNFETRNVKSMELMFSRASAFNQPIIWNTSQLTNITRMFMEASSFNSYINLNVCKVDYGESAFAYTTSLTTDLSHLNFKIPLDESMFYGSALTEERLPKFSKTECSN